MCVEVRAKLPLGAVTEYKIMENPELEGARRITEPNSKSAKC